jgi:hypothetical protein
VSASKTPALRAIDRYLAAGVLVALPIVIYIIWDDWLERLSIDNEALFFAFFIAGAVLIIGGMYWLESRNLILRLKWAGAACWILVLLSSFFWASHLGE